MGTVGESRVITAVHLAVELAHELHDVSQAREEVCGEGRDAEAYALRRPRCMGSEGYCYEEHEMTKKSGTEVRLPHFGGSGSMRMRWWWAGANK